MIVLLTDFGYSDVYAGVMKGVCAGIAPRTPVVELTHGIPPGDIRRAAFQLWSAAPYFPAGAIFVVVVDPGVGGPRRAIAAHAGGHTFVAPDNGVLTYVLVEFPLERAVELSDPMYHLSEVSATFHGRDVFAPAGAHLAAGVPLAQLGPSIKDPARIALPRLEVASSDQLAGEVLFADRFGNLVTSIGRLRRTEKRVRLDPWLPGVESLELPAPGSGVRLPQGDRIPFERSFGAVPHGEPLAYIGSSGMLEIGINRGNAAQALKLSSSDEIVFEAAR